MAGLMAEELKQRGKVLRSERGSAWEFEQWRPQAIRKAFEELGPFYTKVGQILSTRPDLVSEPVRQELGKLHDQVTPAPFTVFEPVLEEELGLNWRRNFQEIETARPLGAASLAQVYRVSLRGRRPAVIKVQRPDIEPIVRADMAILRRATRLIGRCAPKFTSVLDLDAMLGVIFDAMRPELDFRLEAGNMDRARPIVEQFETLSVPEVLHATPRVLIQSLAPGYSIRDAKRPDFLLDERLEIGRDLLALMFHSYFIHRTFHADPHPGNIFVAPGEKASIIDWGMVGNIDRHLSHSMVRVLLGLVLNDAPTAARAWTEMGYLTQWTQLRAFASDMAIIVPKVHAASLEELNFGVTLGTVLRQSAKRGIATSPMVSILAKSFANLEGAVRYLAPELMVVEVFQEELPGILFELAAELFSPAQTAKLFTDLMLTAATGYDSIRSIVHDLADQELSVQVRKGLQPDVGGSLLKKLGIGSASLLAGALAVHLLRKR